MLKENTINEPSYFSSKRKRRRPRLRLNHHLMEPDELRPEERWDRIVDLLALMSMPEAKSASESGVLACESGNQKC